MTAAAAVAQIEQLSSPTGPIQLQEVLEKDGFTWMKVSLDMQGVEHAPGGIRVRGREVFWFLVKEDFPLNPPHVLSSHRRWAGTPHVQWGSQLCLYAAPSVEWSPPDGMRGLVDRLVRWVERAALGDLDPEGQPLHPPAVYPTSSAGHLVVRADLGDRVPWATGDEKVRTDFAWCVTDGDRVDVLEWMNFADIASRVLDAEFAPSDNLGRPHVVAVAGYISEQIGFEYPKKAQDLFDALERAGLHPNQLLEDLARARLVNAHIESKLSDHVELPNLVVLGTPSRRVDSDLLAHISAWRLEGTGHKLAEYLSDANWGVLKSHRDKVLELAGAWIAIAEISWMRVWEDRSEVTRPRDGGTPASALQGKKVLLLGAGALGGPIAEFCVRAGVQHLVVADEGRIGPGILARQPFADADLTKPKATVLAARLKLVQQGVIVEGVVGDAVNTVLSKPPAAEGFDLVIDATADVGVRTAIELRRTANRADWPDLISVIIGHDASNGIVTFSRKAASGGPTDVLRKFALKALSDPTLADIAEDFFPAQSRTEMFFPEPGCSSPTFVGSQADVVSLAGMLFNEGLTLATASETGALGATAVRRGSRTKPGVQPYGWRSDIVIDDAGDSGYEIRISDGALREMRAEARRGRRVRGPQVETGGMLLGAIDEASMTINIDRAAGPPPDSSLSALRYQHGVQGTQQVIDERRQLTGNRQGFVGLWHTHPYGVASPSPVDDEGMWQLVNLHDVGRRAVMVILGGSSWGDWLEDGTPPSIYARVSRLTGGDLSQEDASGIFVLGPETFPGGFGYPPGFHSRGRTGRS